VLVVALGLAWLMDRDRLRVDYNGNLNIVMRAQHREGELRRAIQAEGYDVNWNEGRNAFDLKKAP
jgi:hypothetical protein